MGQEDKNIQISHIGEPSLSKLPGLSLFTTIKAITHNSLGCSISICGFFLLALIVVAVCNLCVGVLVCACYGVQVKARGQLLKVSSLLSWVLGVKARLSGLLGLARSSPDAVDLDLT